ncbi:MAG: MFS transporter [Arachnia sp.]
MPSSPLNALAHYKSLFAISSGRSMALAVAARAPYAMIPLGTMTAITASTGSVASGGLATGVVSVATAVASPLVGRWADKRGQRFVLRLLTPLNALALVMLLVAALSGWDGPLLWAACLFVGVTSLPIGSFTRARWVAAARQPRDVSTAFSYESTVDELVFVLGPAFVGIAASAAIPAAPLALAAALVLLAGMPFAITAPAVVEVPAANSASILRPSIGRVLWAVVPAIIVMACIGTFFGSVQAAVTERSLEFDLASRAGLVYALMGVGSAVTALLAVVIPAAVRLSNRVLVGGLGMTVFILVTWAQGSLVMTALSLLVAGLFVGPTMVTAFSVAERRSPRGGTGVAMTAMQSAITVGVSLGAAGGGALAADNGATGAFLMAAAAALVIAATGTVMMARVRASAPLTVADLGVERVPAL